MNYGKVAFCCASYALVTTVLLLSSGCSGDADPTETTTKPPAVDPIKHYAAADLPELNNYMLPLDEDRLRVAPVNGWNPTSRSKDHIVQFVKGRASLPRMTITAEDVEWGDAWQQITEDQLAEMVSKLKPDLNKETLLEGIKPLILGEHPCVRYVQSIRFTSSDGRSLRAERQTVKTIANGRLYTITLDVAPNKILNDRDAAYAVVAGLQFLDPPQEGEEEKQEAKEEEGEGNGGL